MKLLFCVICGTNKNLQHHHIVPKSLGGDDHAHNILTLCCDHHDWIHGITKTRNMPFSELVKAGQRNANNFGGRPPLNADVIDSILHLWKTGSSYRQIRKLTGASLATIQRYVNEYKSEILVN